MELNTALNWRYAVKLFSDRTVDAGTLERMLEATRLSASSYGLQPYRILLVSSGETRRELVQYSYGQDKVLHSSHLAVFAARTALDAGEIDRYIERVAQSQARPVQELDAYAQQIKGAIAGKDPDELLAWAKNQAYLALGNFLAAAAVQRVDTCPMEGFDAAGYDRVLGLRERQLATAVICPVGYRHPDDAYAGYPKVRTPYHQMIREI